eukprot:5360676-Prymnesium_polylepis.1
MPGMPKKSIGSLPRASTRREHNIYHAVSQLRSQHHHTDANAYSACNRHPPCMPRAHTPDETLSGDAWKKECSSNAQLPARVCRPQPYELRRALRCLLPTSYPCTLPPVLSPRRNFAPAARSVSL